MAINDFLQQLKPNNSRSLNELIEHSFTLKKTINFEPSKTNCNDSNPVVTTNKDLIVNEVEFKNRMLKKRLVNFPGNL